MFRPLAPLLTVLVLLASCGKPADRTTSNADRLLMAAAGSYDNVKDSLERLPDGLRRRISWRQRPPVPAREVRVVFDEEQRPTSWQLDLIGTTASLSDIAGTNDVDPVGRTATHDIYRVRSGPLEGTVVLVAGGNVTLLSAPYIVNWQKDLLRFTRP